MSIIVPKGLSGIKGINALTESQKKKWLQQKINEGVLKPGVSEKIMDRVFRNGQFVAMYGTNALSQYSPEERDEMVKNKLIDTAFTDRYKDKASEEEWDFYNQFSNEGKLQMLENNLYTRSELDKLKEQHEQDKLKHQERLQNNWLAMANESRNPLLANTRLEAYDTLSKVDEEKNNKKLDSILESERQRTLKETQPLANQLEAGFLRALDNGQISYAEIENQFNAIAENLPHYKAFKGETELENFDISDKIKILAQVQAIAQSGKSDFQVINAVDRNIQNFIADNQDFFIKSGLAAKNLATGTVGALGSEIIGLIAPFITRFDPKRTADFLNQDWVQWIEGLDTYNLWTLDAQRQARENGGISPDQRISYSDNSRGVLNTLMDMGAMAKFLAPALIMRGVGGMVSNVGKNIIMSSVRNLAKAIPNKTLQKALLNTGIYGTKALDLATVFSSSAGISHMYSIGTYNESVEENKAKVQQAIGNQIQNRILQQVENEASNMNFNSEEEANYFKSQRLKELQEYYSDPKNLEKLTQLARQDINADELERQGELKAAKAYMINATTEALRMSAENALFRRWMFAKGTKANLGIKSSDLGLVWDKTKEGLNKFRLVGKTQDLINPILRNVWGGFESNYLDDVTARFAKEFGQAEYNNFLMSNLTPKQSVGVAKEFINPFMQAIEGAVDALGDSQSWWDGFIGAGGSILQIAPSKGLHKAFSRGASYIKGEYNYLKNSEFDKIIKSSKASEISDIIDKVLEKKYGVENTENIPQKVRDSVYENLKETIRQKTLIERANDFIFMPILSEMKESQNRQRAIEKSASDKVKEIEQLKENGTFDRIAEAFAADSNLTMAEGSGNMMDAADKKTATAFQVVKTLERWAADPIMSKHPEVQKNLQTLQRITEAKSAEEIAEFIDQAQQRPENKHGIPVSNEEIFNTLKDNAQKLSKMRERYQKAKKSIEKTAIGKNMPEHIKNDFIQKTIMMENWQERLNDLTTQLGLSSEKINNGQRHLAQYGSKKVWQDKAEAQRKVVDDLIETERKLKTKLNSKSRNDDVSQKRGFLNRVNTLTQRYLDRWETKSSIKRQLKHTEKIRKEAEKKYQQIQDDHKNYIKKYESGEYEQRHILSAQEILGLDIEDMAYMLDKAHRDEYSNEQQNTIKEAESILRKRLPEDSRNDDVVQMVKDASTLRDRIKDTEKAYDNMWSDPKGVSEWYNSMQALRRRQEKAYFVQSMYEDQFQILNNTWEQMQTQEGFTAQDFVHELVTGNLADGVPYTKDFLNEYKSAYAKEGSALEAAIKQAQTMLTVLNDTADVIDSEGIDASNDLSASVLMADVLKATEDIQILNMQNAQEAVQQSQNTEQSDNSIEDTEEVNTQKVEKVLSTDDIYERLEYIKNQRQNEEFADEYNNLYDKIIEKKTTREHKNSDSLKDQKQAEKNTEGQPDNAARTEASEIDDVEGVDLEDNIISETNEEKGAKILEEEHESKLDMPYDSTAPEDPVLKAFFDNSGGQISWAADVIIKGIYNYNNYADEEKTEAIKAISELKDIKYDNLEEFLDAVFNTGFSVAERASGDVKSLVEKLERKAKEKALNKEQKNQQKQKKQGKAVGRVSTISMAFQKKVKGPIYQYLDNKGVFEFIEHAVKSKRFNKKTNVYFLTDSTIKGDFTDENRPIFAAVEVDKNETVGSKITIKVKEGKGKNAKMVDKHYQIIGAMPANNSTTTEGSSHMEAVRRLAKNNTQGIQLVQMNGQPLFTKFMPNGVERTRSWDNSEATKKKPNNKIKDLITQDTGEDETDSPIRKSFITNFLSGLKKTTINWVDEKTGKKKSVDVPAYQPEGVNSVAPIYDAGMHEVKGGFMGEETLGEYYENNGTFKGFNKRMDRAMFALSKLFKKLSIPVNTLDGIIDNEEEILEKGKELSTSINDALKNIIFIPEGYNIRTNVTGIEKGNPNVEITFVDPNGEILADLGTINLNELQDKSSKIDTEKIASSILKGLIFDENDNIRMANSTREGRKYSLIKWQFSYNEIDNINKGNNMARISVVEMIEDGILEVGPTVVSLKSEVDRISFIPPIDENGKPTQGKYRNAERQDSSISNKDNGNDGAPTKTPTLGTNTKPSTVDSEDGVIDRDSGQPLENKDKKGKKDKKEKTTTTYGSILDQAFGTLDLAVKKMQKLNKTWELVELKQDDGSGNIEVKRYYQNKETGEKVKSVTSIVGKKFGKDNPYGTVSSCGGNSVDVFKRDFFNFSRKEDMDFSKYPNATKEQWQRFHDQLMRLKNYLIDPANGYGIKKFITTGLAFKGDVIVKDTKGKTYKIPLAGTLDMLAFDNQGRAYIIDFKTKHVNPNTGKSYIGKDDINYWTNQLRLYKQLVENTLGIKIHGVMILPSDVQYPTPVGAKNFDGTPKKDANTYYYQENAEAEGIRKDQLMFKDARKDGDGEQFRALNPSYNFDRQVDVEGVKMDNGLIVIDTEGDVIVNENTIKEYAKQVENGDYGVETPADNRTSEDEDSTPDQENVKKTPAKVVQEQTPIDPITNGPAAPIAGSPFEALSNRAQLHKYDDGTGTDGAYENALKATAEKKAPPVNNQDINTRVGNERENPFFEGIDDIDTQNAVVEYLKDYYGATDTASARRIWDNMSEEQQNDVFECLG